MYVLKREKEKKRKRKILQERKNYFLLAYLNSLEFDDNFIEFDYYLYNKSNLS